MGPLHEINAISLVERKHKGEKKKTDSETDPRSQNLKHWSHVKKFAEHDPPVIATPQSPASAPGKRQEYEMTVARQT